MSLMTGSRGDLPKEQIANEGLLGSVSPGLFFPGLPTASALEVSPYTALPPFSKWLQEPQGGPQGCCPSHTPIGAHAKIPAT